VQDDVAVCTRVPRLNTLGMIYIFKISGIKRELETSFANHSVPSKIFDNSTSSVPLISDVSIITSTVTSLLKGRKGRKLNVIIHGVPESTSEISTERKAHDIAQISKVLSEADTSVEDAVRLGKRDPSKRRVGIPSLAVKKSISVLSYMTLTG